MQALLRSSTGSLFFLAIVLTLYAQLVDGSTSVIAGGAIWLYFILCFNGLAKRQKKQNAIILGTGLITLGVAFAQNPDAALLRPIAKANQLIITLIGAVTFLRLIASLDETLSNQRGPKAILSTLIGTHLIASVINLSAILLVADRIKKDQKLTSIQGITLLRGFGSAANWSPFFAAMGVTLISVQGASLTTIILATLPVALVSLAFTGWQLCRRPDASDFEGYPLGLKSLKLPMSLAALVLIGHQVLPQISVIMLVSVLSLIIVIAVLCAQKGLVKSTKEIGQHISIALPQSSGEVSLFLSSSVLAAGLSALLQSTQIDLTPDQFGALEASLTILVLIGLSFVGVHPVTSNLIAATILLPSVSDPNLLAIALLFSWALGVILSPLSGTQILLQTRYGLSARALFKANLPYLALMLPVCLTTIWIYTH